MLLPRRLMKSASSPRPCCASSYLFDSNLRDCKQRKKHILHHRAIGQDGCSGLIGVALRQRLLHARRVIGADPLRNHLGRHALGVPRLLTHPRHFFSPGKRADKHLKHRLQPALLQRGVAQSFEGFPGLGFGGGGVGMVGMVGAV